ncbi:MULTISPECIES: helix-turn-helix domain-containing protein [Bacteria]|jgi:ribosome-binding protein aMBF1 (putative translation factor)|uniref:helix-turn-helix domain-containing protein n=1 Tax=Bacteria TaxID=2 RepID=UPI0005E82035|nr:MULTISPECIES: helix-turn-helix transcriptional regulator [Bacilli]HDI2955034.1 helix-turn-helix transcriptional regulator [Staphylococcus aureus]MBB2509115.1 hypothetical protein [Staphylococcus cohnii subsp. barensis]MBK3720548.1 helix-turn-helix protein [Staphylococcus arlettae]MCM3073733.1 helix-turn-helix transcriptional regulator [Staphylococcus equorum]MDW4023898.1 helix-turn-helix transcriptional regulator [Staphylococcus saprophyticus]
MSLVNRLIQEDIKNNPSLEEVYKKQEDAMDLSVRMVGLRKDLNLSQEELASKLNTSVSTIRRIENGDIDLNND